VIGCRLGNALPGGTFFVGSQYELPTLRYEPGLRELMPTGVTQQIG